MARFTLNVNGSRRTAEAPPEAMLIDVLRYSLALAGTKAGCREGACGSCTVLIDGRAARSCLTRAADAVGKRIVTIEGLAPASRLHPVQQAFLDKEAFQCGYCTPGFILAATALLARNPAPTESQVRVALQGHLCRCGTQPRILEAVRLASEVMRRG